MDNLLFNEMNYDLISTIIVAVIFWMIGCMFSNIAKRRDKKEHIFQRAGLNQVIRDYKKSYAELDKAFVSMSNTCSKLQGMLEDSLAREKILRETLNKK